MFAASKSGRASAAAATDPNFRYVPLLLNTTSTNGQQNNTFLDSSTNNFTITRNGTPTQGSVTPYWPNGYWSNYFGGTGNYLTTPASASNQLTGDFTIEMWAYQTVAAAASGLIGINNTVSSGGANFGLYLDVNGRIVFYIAGNGTTYTSTNIVLTPGTWAHIAFVRSSTTNTIYVNGIVVLTNTATPSWSGTPVITVGRLFGDNTGATFTGYLSNVRIVKGVAVYSGTSTTVANFTVPTTPLATTQAAGTNISAITGTSTYLLSCQSNRFIDNSASNFSFTISGTPRTQPFQPFSPTASYTTALYGGSGYFNGSSQLTNTNTSAFDFSSSATDFTWESWVYNTNPGVDAAVISARDNGTNGWGMYIRSNTLYMGSVITGSGYADRQMNTTVIPGNTWAHVAIVKDSTGYTGYVNGVAGTKVALSAGTNYQSSQPVVVGAVSSIYNFPWTGYLASVRIVKGTAVYTGNFTPPSLAPLQTSGSASAACYPSTTNVNTIFAAANTSLLENYTNAGIYDAAVQNNGITAGSAQTSITQFKWSPTSMRFNGTTDYVYINSPAGSQLDLSVGQQDWTIECWIYFQGSAGVVFGRAGSSGTSNPQYWLFINANGSAQMLINSLVYNLAIGTFASNAWSYFALCRKTSQIRAWVNGTAQTVQTAPTMSSPGSQTFYLGARLDPTAASFFTGYVQDFRITAGIARYDPASSASITVPTAAFPTR